MLTSSKIISSLIHHVQLALSSWCLLDYDAFLWLYDRLGWRLLNTRLICLTSSRSSRPWFRQLRGASFRGLLLLNRCGFLTARGASARNFIISGLFLKGLIPSLSLRWSGRLGTSFLSGGGRLRGFLTSSCLGSGCRGGSWFPSRDSCLTFICCRLGCGFTWCSHICFCSILTCRCDCLTTSSLTLGDIKRLIPSALLSIVDFAINSVPTGIRLADRQIKCQSRLSDPILYLFF